MWIPLLGMSPCPSPFMPPAFAWFPSVRSSWASLSDDQDGCSPSTPHPLLRVSFVEPWVTTCYLWRFCCCLMFNVCLSSPSNYSPDPRAGTILILLVTAQDLAQSLQLSSSQDMFVEIVSGSCGFPELPPRFLLGPTDRWNELQATQPDVSIFRWALCPGT